MNSNNNSNNTSIVIDLERLQKSYSNLLTKYKQSVSDYINYLNTDGSSNQIQLTFVQGMAYIGTGSAGQSTATSLQECQANCASNSNCTGATFVSNRCNLRTGESNLTPSSNESYAIIPKGKQLLLNMNDLNNQLLTTNNQIMNKIKLGQPVYNNVEYENTKKTQELINNYRQLELERENIIKLIEDYETLDTTENENEIKITKNYYTYILLFLLAIVVVFLLIKLSFPATNSLRPSSSIQYGGQLTNRAYYVIITLVILVISINFLYKYKF